MNKILVTGCAMATAFAAVAMPTKTELAQAQKPVEASTKADLAALKAGRKTAKEVADSHISLAKETKNQAEKYLYYQGAFKLYAQSREYELASGTLMSMENEIADISPEVIDELVGRGRLCGVIKEQDRQISRPQEDSKEVCASESRTGCRLLRKIEVDKEKLSVSECTETVGDYTWSYRVKNGEAVIVAVSPKPTGGVSIPSKLGGVGVTSIIGGFGWCDKLVSVVIPNGVRSIGPSAFQRCVGLKTVMIPEGVESIGNQAFYACGELTSVMIPQSVKNIGCAAFTGCSKIAVFSVDSRNPSYSERNGMLCSKDGTRLLAGVKIGTNGEASIPAGVKTIEDGAFQGHGGLKAVTIPASLTNINASAFAHCSEFRSFRVEKGNLFYKSENGLLLTKDGMTLVQGVNGVVAIPEGVKNIGDGAFLARRGLESVEIPVGVTNIGGAAFCWCIGLKSVVIPEGVVSIGANAFQRCPFKTITIPASVTNLAEKAIWLCGDVASVTMLGEKPNAPDNAICDCGNLKAIHVPAKAKSWTGMKAWQGIPLVFDAK